MKANASTAQDAFRSADPGRYTSLHRRVRAVPNLARIRFRVPAAVWAEEVAVVLVEARVTAEAAAAVVVEAGEGNLLFGT